MRLGVNLSADHAVELAREAERLGYDVVLVPEGFRSDAVSVLGWIGSATERIGIASGVLQIPGRTPVMTAFTAATLHALSGGRFRLGLGISNPHVTEGWHGVDFARPLARTREYVDVVRLALSGEPVALDGECFRLPLPDGRGAPLRLAGAPGPGAVPIYLAAVGPRNLALAGEVADGWFGVFSSPDTVARAVEHLRAGRAGASLDGFEVMVSVPMVTHDDPHAAAAPIKHYVARFLSLGHRHENFYFALLDRMGYGKEAAEVQDRFRDGDAAGAAAAVPFDFVDETALIGSPRRIGERMRSYAEAGVTTLAISPFSPDVSDRLATLRSARQALES